MVEFVQWCYFIYLMLTQGFVYMIEVYNAPLFEAPV